MTIILRDYQKEAAVKTIEFLDEERGNPIIALPTGTGKSLIIAALLRYYAEHRGERLLVLTHVKELISQNEKAARAFVEHPENIGVYSAGLGRKEADKQIVFGGIASVHRQDIGKFDKILIDECHLVPVNTDTMYRKFLATQKAPVIGLSATPYRLNGGPLVGAGVFDALAYDRTDFDGFNWFVDEGYLATLVTYETAVKLDVSKVRIRGGEFKPGDLQKAVDRAAITAAAVADMVQRGEGRNHWLIFTAGVEHSEHVTKALNKAGVSAECVHHKKTNAERDRIVDGFKAGDFKAIVNSQILTTGFDSPWIDLIGVLRPMMSTGLWVQMLGRGTRPYPDKRNCLVLDYAGNTRRLGPINDVVVPNTRSKKRTGKAPVRTCPQCYAINHARAAECNACGYHFPRPKLPAINRTPSKLEIVATKKRSGKKDKPDVTVDVTRVEYTQHIKKSNGSTSLKITYWCGMIPYHEWIFPGNRNRWIYANTFRWWQRRTHLELPDTVAAALEIAPFIKKPRRLIISRNGKYPVIKDYIF